MAYTAVIVSVVLISYPVDVSKTPPISPAMQCVMTSLCSTSVVFPLGALRGRHYRAVQWRCYLMLFVAATATERFIDVAWMHSVIAICEGAPQTVMFAPMLDILFDGRRAGEWLAKMKAAGILPNLLSYNSAARPYCCSYLAFRVQVMKYSKASMTGRSSTMSLLHIAEGGPGQLASPP